MDIKEIIKWFIPCFHILLATFVKMDTKLTFIFLILFFNSCPTFCANVLSGKEVVSENNAKNLDLIDNSPKFNQSDLVADTFSREDDHADNSLHEDTSIGRTFGRPFMKKIMSGLLPLIFQVGAASTWAVLAALVGVKTLFVTLVILKLLLVAGALKAGTLLASKGHHQSHGWEPQHPSKEIHLHIHNGQHGGVVEQPPTWNRNEYDLGTKSYVLNPYSGQMGPQTISTPYGNYVKIDK